MLATSQVLVEWGDDVGIMWLTGLGTEIESGYRVLMHCGYTVVDRTSGYRVARATPKWA